MFPSSLKSQILANPSIYHNHSSVYVHYYDGEEPSYENGFYIDSTW